MFTQKSINVFHSVEEIRPFSFFFQNLALSKASTDDKCNSLTFFRMFTSAKPQPISKVIWQSHGVHIVNINVKAKFHHNIPLRSRDSAIITFSKFGARQSLDQWKMSFRNLSGYILSISMFTQSLWLYLVNINVYATVYQNISLSLRDRAIFTFSKFGARQSLDRR